MPLSPGRKLGPYEVVAPLGAGGMGEVYRAHDSRLGRDVAVKVLPAHLMDSPEVRARFEREARAVSSLNHPHICTLHDIGREGDTDYIVMELVEGETLADRLAKGALPIDQVLKLGVEICDALDRAHRAGIVHRDLKPGNIMLSKTGAKLMDFGLARAGGPTGPMPASGITLTNVPPSPTMAQPLTAQGSIVGTFMYMAPEQLEGAEADSRSDLWALGCVLYEMATGQPAFQGKTQASLISSIMKDQPRPIGELQSLTPPGLDRVVRACLAKDPDERIQTAHDVGLQLRWLAEGGSQLGVPAPVAARRKQRERLSWLLAGVLGAAAAGLAILHFGFPPPPPATLRFEVSPPSTVQSQDSPRISPDGKTLAYNATDSTGTSRIWIRPLGVLEAQALPGTDGAKRPFWSPNSKFLGFIANGKLKKISIAGGPPTVICDAPTGADGAWSTKDVILFDGSALDPIYRVAATGGIATPVVRADSASGSTQVGWPEFLPDGHHFLYLAITSQSILRVGDLDSKLRKDLGPCESQTQYLAPGRLLYSRGGSLVVQRFDTGALKFTGEPVPVAEQVGASSVGGADFRASNNGVLVYSTRLADSGELAELDRTGRLLRLLEVPPNGLYPTLSPDERRVAFRAVDPTSRTRDIWIVDRVRNLSTRFTFDKGDEYSPMWSPDGRRIAYFATGNPAGIVVKDLTGSGATSLLYPSKDDVTLTCWSRDGSRIFFGLRGANASDIWTLAMDGSGKAQPFLNAPYSESEGRLSPDGRYLAYVSDESGREEVYVQPFPDRSDKWQVSTGGGNDPEWNGDGSELYYLSPALEMMAVPTGTKQAFDPGTPHALFTTSVLFPGGQRVHYDVTGDGQTFLVYRTASARTIPTTTVVVNWTEGLPQR